MVISVVSSALCLVLLFHVFIFFVSLLVRTSYSSLGHSLFSYKYFSLLHRKRNFLAFGNEELSLQRLNYSFVCNLWSWVRMSIVLSPSSLISFFDWLGSK